MRRLIAALALGLGCAAQLRTLPTTVCHRSKADGATEPTEAEWTALLHDDGEGAATSCEAALARTPPSAPRCEHEERSPAPTFAIAPRLVAHAQRTGEDDLVWIATHRAGEHELSGPIAIVRRTALGLEVQALGTHTGPSEQVSLRLLRAGASTAIAIESADRGERVADLMIQAGGALIPAVIDEPGRCRSRARVILRRSDDRGASGRWRERRVRSATLEEGEGAVIVREHLRVDEIDPADPEAPPRARRESDRVRRLVPEGARLRADQPPIDLDEAPDATAVGARR